MGAPRNLARQLTSSLSSSSASPVRLRGGRALALCARRLPRGGGEGIALRPHVPQLRALGTRRRRACFRRLNAPVQRLHLPGEGGVSRGKATVTRDGVARVVRCASQRVVSHIRRHLRRSWHGVTPDLSPLHRRYQLESIRECGGSRRSVARHRHPFMCGSAAAAPTAHRGTASRAAPSARDCWGSRSHTCPS